RVEARAADSRVRILGERQELLDTRADGQAPHGCNRRAPDGWILVVQQLSYTLARIRDSQFSQRVDRSRPYLWNRRSQFSEKQAGGVNLRPASKVPQQIGSHGSVFD